MSTNVGDVVSIGWSGRPAISWLVLVRDLTPLALQQGVLNVSLDMGQESLRSLRDQLPADEHVAA